MADNIAETGIWFDKDSGKVTEKQPRNARQLVAPGRVIDAAAQAVLDRYDYTPPSKKAPVKKSAAKSKDD